MIFEFDDREATLVLAALRNWQDQSRTYDLAAEEYEAYFEFHEPLSSEEIDSLCARMVDAALRQRLQKKD